jgi:hypothetical protein
VRHAPPSARVIYRRLKDGHVQVWFLWCEPREHAGLTAWIGADRVRGRGESLEYDETGQIVLSSSRGAAPPRTTPPGDDEWVLFRKLERLTGRVSPVLL